MPTASDFSGNDVARVNGKTITSHELEVALADDLVHLLCSERGVDRLDESRPAEVRIAQCAGLVLICHVAEANTSIHVREANRAPSPRMSESTGIGPKRTLGRGQHEPQPKPGGKLENRIETARL